MNGTARTDGTDDIDQIARLALGAGIRRVHAIAWRDLDDPTSGGSEIHANEILTRWARAGLDVTLQAGAVAGLPPVANRDGVRVHRRGSATTSWVAGPVSLRRRIDRATDAVLEVWHGVNFLAPLWSGVPTVGVFHHVHTRQFHQVLPPGAAHVAAFLERTVYPRIYRRHALVALSASVRDEMVATLGWDPTNLHVVEPGVAERFRPGGERSPAPMVVSVGRFMPQKGFVDAVDVLVAVKARVPALEAVLVGDGPQYGEVERRVRDADATGWLRLAGRVEHDELVGLYRRAWTLLSASRREGWGMTVTEAGACGTPAVVTAITGHREAVIDGTTGYLANDTVGLADRLVDILRDPARAEHMGRAAAEHASQYRWDATARRVFEVLAAVAIARGPRSW
ncbi:MAG TPA: glycosyltransferase family 4 protein [Acidimicrobiales bacterium]